MNFNKLTASLLCAVALSACQQGGQKNAHGTSPAETKLDPGSVVAFINGTPISKTAVEILNAEVAQRRGGAKIAEDKIIDELIKREVLRQDAIALHLDQQAEHSARIDNALRMVMSQIAAESFMESAPITDADIQAAYDQQITANKQSEYKASHILVETEKQARDLIGKLQKGGKFADLAKKNSKDPGSKNNGGDLGWFSPQQMVAPFSAAVTALANGEFSQEPVKTQFGWHVIMREDSRDQTPPPLDAVKDQLRSMLKAQRLQQHIADLMAKAKIERTQTATEPKPSEPAAEEPSQPKAVE
ncbi:MAG: peptidylprolyl isomerase [Methylococcaceae bacterium]